VVEKTAIADAEVEYKDHTSNTIHVKFKVAKSNNEGLIDNDILIWTTTPWTIPGNRALAYSADLEYVLIQIIEINHSSIAKINDKVMIAKDLQDSVMKEIGVTKTKVKKSFLGKELKDTECKHPFNNIGYDFAVKVLEADFVTLEQGTGVVHVAPGHGADD
jgi:isoleucyl-tRNA synthetase